MVYVSCTHCHHEVTINSFSAFQGAALLMAVKHARSIVDVTKAIEAKQPRQSSNAANPFLRNPIDRVPAFHETIRDATAVRQTVTFAGEDSA